MSITTYAELQAAAANWLVRSDLTARVPEFIALAEARLNRVLRTRRGEVDQALTGTIGASTIALPATYGEAVTCWLVDGVGRQGLRFCDPASLLTMTSNSRPQFWSIAGASLAFECPLDQAYGFVLRMLVKYALSDASPTNALLADAPDIYLFATLSEAAPFLRDADLASAYETKLNRAISELNTKEARSRAQQTLSTEPGQLVSAGRRDGFSIDRGF
jgi:hypothetical protein